MKRLLLMAVLAFSALSMSADNKSRFEIKAGLGASSIVGADASTDLKFAWKLGVNYDIAVSKHFSVIPGAEFASKGFKTNLYRSSDVINGYYLDIPVLAAAKISLGSNANLAIKAGPYIACGLFGTEYTDGRHTTDYFDATYGFKRFDAGIVTGVQFEVNHFIIGAEYSRGLVKMAENADLFNEAFGVTVGYAF